MIDIELLFSKTANEEDYLELIRNSYPDTYDFLISLKDGEPTIIGWECDECNEDN